MTRGLQSSFRHRRDRGGEDRQTRGIRLPSHERDRRSKQQATSGRILASRGETNEGTRERERRVWRGGKREVSTRERIPASMR
ncbi:hypothetical protein MRB53_026490 [Persea americana]|uniref:Uncharacterized protein n=1 Tax=Persea americana TaxID=3435 RepID=A0ACC2LIA5_PERAE|nr:hypothetical protein MRB53_026490 [Persea americana]